MESVAGGEAALGTEALPSPVEGRAAPHLAVGQPAAALIRPEHVRHVAGGLPARIVERVFLGEIAALRCVLAGGLELWSRRFAAEAPASDETGIGWDREAVTILPETE